MHKVWPGLSVHNLMHYEPCNCSGLGGLYLYKLFTIVNLLNGPLNSIGQQLPSLFASFASLGRNQGFLQLPEEGRGRVGWRHERRRRLGQCQYRRQRRQGIHRRGFAERMHLCVWEDKTKSHNILKDITLKLAPRELGQIKPPHFDTGGDDAGDGYREGQGAQGNRDAAAPGNTKLGDKGMGIHRLKYLIFNGDDYFRAVNDKDYMPRKGYERTLEFNLEEPRGREAKQGK
ncbi:hypothetical protein C8J57DRAFT_1609306 [Mycena rebaudengoi]|nr:hypothetical protein C8J57DRAFT_1609306 [Mycena rebaudengoi]